MESSPVDSSLGDQAGLPGSVHRARVMMEAKRLEELQLAAQGSKPKKSAKKSSRKPSVHGVEVPAPLKPQKLKSLPSSAAEDHLRPDAVAMGARAQQPSSSPQWSARQQASPTSRRHNNSPTRSPTRSPPRPERTDQRSTSTQQRPAKPSYIPSLSPAPRLETPASTVAGSPQIRFQSEYWEDNFQTPGSGVYPPANTPARTSQFLPSSRPSTISSTGSIPDFPMPGSSPSLPLPSPAFLPSRRSPNPGPPSSSRRGYSSYYSQSSFMPVVEEHPEGPRSAGSAASSQTATGRWVPDSPQYFFVPDDSAMVDSQDPEPGEEVREPHTTNDEERGLVRQASMGKRHKPSLTTIGGAGKSDGEDSRAPTPAPRVPTPGSRAATPASRTSTPTPRAHTPSSNRGEHRRGPSGIENHSGNAFATAPSGIAATALVSRLEQSHRGGTNSGSSSSASNNRYPRTAASDETLLNSAYMSEKRWTPSPDLSDPRAIAIRDGLEKASEINLRRGPGFGDRKNSLRRPPHLNLNPVKEVESRSSLTSLPDLIRRATKLATALDRGRPSSRFALNDSPEKGGVANGAIRRSGSISDMLASFPHVSPFEGQGTRQGHGQSQWPSRLASSTPDSDDGKGSPHRKRRGPLCCGIPRWIVILLILGLLLLTPAIVLPVTLVLLPKQRKSDNASATVEGKCSTQMPCHNGGTSVYDGTVCHCVCINNFTGNQCTVDGGTGGCVTTTIHTNDTDIEDATLGSAIPWLFEGGSELYQIPLDPSKVLAMFSSSNLSCGTENALVTFNGRASRLNVSPSSLLIPTATAPAKRAQTEKAQPTTIVSITSDDLANAPPTGTSAGAATSTSRATGSPLVVSEDVLDFARVCVLYILQQSNDLDVAVTAQQNLQSYLQQPLLNSNVSVGYGLSVDFKSFQIASGQGLIGSPPP